MEAEKYILEMRGIVKAFPGVNALQNVDLQVRPGSVHALMGENGAGKSTLMKCLFGIYRKDSGRILLEGGEVDFHSPHEALVHGVSMVHQELEQVREQSVMENVWLGRFPRSGFYVREREMYAKTRELFASMDIDIDPRVRLAALTVSQRQMVDIVKAVSYNCKILVMDEPTSSLTEKEVMLLFRILRKLREDGVGIIYISHKINEIYEIADEITVMRDGQGIRTSPKDDMDVDRLMTLMVGRKLENRFPPNENQPGGVLLQVNGLSEKAESSIRDISFELRAGEILGVAGLLGAGRTELLETLYGMRPARSGSIKLGGRVLDNRNPAAAIQNGFALCTEERKHDGIFLGLSIEFNAVIANIRRYRNRLRYLNGKQIARDTDWVVKTLNVKTPGTKAVASTLSGGNQQKVIIGRWLLMEPEVFLVDDPTRGIDVGAKYEIYQLIIELAKRGKGVIMTSSEMPELLGISDRIMVLSNGRLADIYDLRGGTAVTQEDILRSAAKYL